MRYDAVIFDRDGTLLRFDPAGMATLAEQCALVAPQLDAATLSGSWQRWSGSWPATVADEPAFWVRYWTSLAAAYNLTPVQCEGLASVAATYHTMFRAYSDAADVLSGLYRRGLRLALLTNFELPSVEQTLSSAGLDPSWFVVCRSATTLGVRKPDPRAFQAMADLLGVAPARCLVVDDLAEHCAGAREAGMDAVLLDRAGQGTNCQSLTDILSLLD